MLERKVDAETALMLAMDENEKAAEVHFESSYPNLGIATATAPREGR